MVQFLLELLLKQRILAVRHDFHWLLIATKFLTVRLHSVIYVMNGSKDILPPTPPSEFDSKRGDYGPFYMTSPLELNFN